MAILGQFRDLEDPDRFVWVRAFPDHDVRAASLGAFYYGPVWREHGPAANETMVDSDNVLVLRPTVAGSGFELGAERRPYGVAADGDDGLVTATTLSFDAPPDREAVADAMEQVVAPAVAAHGGRLLAHFVTDPTPNGFPVLPVREGESCAVWFCSAGDAGRDAHARMAAEAASALGGRPDAEVRALRPTARSLIRGAAT